MINPDTQHFVEPISAQHERHVRSLTREYIGRASRICIHELPLIPILFDLKGRAAGMYKVHNRDRVIRYNPYIFAKYFEDNLVTTIPHEVAHYVVDIMYGVCRVRPHGAEWRQVMVLLGAEPRATGNYDLSGIPMRKQKRHAYQCTCTMHHISSARHNKILRGTCHYFCRYCKSPLKPVETEK